MSSETMHDLLNFNIDRYLNPYLPHNHLNILPKPITHFLGYRSKSSTEPPVLVQWALMFVSTVAGICLVAGIYNHAPGIARYNPPEIVASLGASAVLDYNAIRSPLAQPRNVVLGHTFSAIVGVAISKLFQLNPDFESISWVAGAVGCAAASLVMSMTNTVHPPGGATAVLACTNKQVIALGWIFVPLILLASLLMMTVACLFNNTLRQYPIYWWTPEDVGQKLHRLRKPELSDVEEGGLKKVESSQTTGSERTLARELSDGGHVDFVNGSDDVQIAPYKLHLPSHIELSNEEVDLLEHLQEKLRAYAEVGQNIS